MECKGIKKDWNTLSVFRRKFHGFRRSIKLLLFNMSKSALGMMSLLGA